VLGTSAPGTKFQRVTKASALSNRTDQAGDRSRALQCPIKALSPTLGTKCGRRERGSRREGRREQSLRDNNSFACRGGERHPGFLEGGALRGASSERRPRSVRALSGYPPARGTAPMTTDVRRVPRRGTSSACATKRMHSTNAGIAASRSRTRPSLGPSTRARRSSLRTAAQASVVGRSPRHHGWANPRKWEKPALGSSGRT
jgi:hypothetical protein